MKCVMLENEIKKRTPLKSLMARRGPLAIPAVKLSVGDDLLEVM
jgi:hypothetical protein